MESPLSYASEALGAGGTDPRGAWSSDDVLRHVAESSSELIVALDSSFRLIAINRACREEFFNIFGAQPELGWSLHQGLAHWPRTLAAAQAVWQRVFQGEAFTVIASFGIERHSHKLYEFSFSPLREATGAVVGGYVVARDVTARRQAEERQRFLAEVGATLSRSIDDEGTIQALARLVVPALARGCGLSAVGESAEERVVGVAATEPELEASLREVLERPALPAGPVGEAVAQALHTGEAVLGDEARVLAVPLVLHGQARGVLVLVRAASDRPFGEEEVALGREMARRATLSLENARLYREARLAIAARDETLGIVSHDLLSPLNAINILCDTIGQFQLPEGKAGEQTRISLGRIQQAVREMNRLIEDLLAVARMEAGRLSLELLPLEATWLLAKARELNESLAVASHLRLEVEGVPGLPRVRADGGRVLQVFQNLVGNAIKFTPPGGRILLRAEVGEGEVRFSVADTGRGVEPEALPHVFDRFWQARWARKAGVGLGLSIVKGFVEAHGGRVWVESRVGEGTTFTFTLPTVE